MHTNWITRVSALWKFVCTHRCNIIYSISTMCTFLIYDSLTSLSVLPQFSPSKTFPFATRWNKIQLQWGKIANYFYLQISAVPLNRLIIQSQFELRKGRIVWEVGSSVFDFLLPVQMAMLVHGWFEAGFLSLLSWMMTKNTFVCLCSLYIYQVVLCARFCRNLFCCARKDFFI